MSNIDHRVVEMQFDNKQFESGIKTSVSSLDRLKKGLNLNDAARGLAGLDRAGRAFSLAGVANGVENLSNKLSTLGIVGITALQNITNSAMNMGKRVVSALTIDPIKTGLQEYETKMNAITTILTNTASKGTSLEDVNKVLNELNEYADKTIYNFAEMTRNIGTFTAAGIDLDRSAIAIKGIANLAAGSGSNAQQASTAMYQLSQALAAGSVKLMDWNSVVNAGMGGELFQNALKETAKQMGIVVDASVPFRESLQDGWITSEVLIKTLEKFANDEMLIKAATQVKTFTQLIDTMKESVQSGWAQSWEHIIGDKDEAAKFFTSINDGFGAIAGAAADARNEMLMFWKADGGRDAIIETLANSFKFLQSLLAPINKAFREIFPPMTGKRLVELSNRIRDISKSFKMGDETAEKLGRTFKGLFALQNIGLQFMTALGKGLLGIVRYLAPARDGFLSITASIGDFLVRLNESIKTSGIFNGAVEEIGDFMRPIADNIKNAIRNIVKTLQTLAEVDLSGIDVFADRVREKFQPVTKLGEFVQNAFFKVIDVLRGIAPIFYSLASVVGGAFQKMGKVITDSFGKIDFDATFGVINSSLFATVLYGIKKFIDNLTEITEGAGGFMEGITDILDGVKGSLEAYQSQLKANVLLMIAAAIGLLALSLKLLSNIDPERLASALTAITIMFGQLFGAMAIFQKVSMTTGFLAMGKTITMMMAFSIAILILANAMTKLAQIDDAGIARGLIAVAGLATVLVASSKALSTSSGRMMRGALGFIVFAVAINILADAVKKIADLDWDGLAKGLVGVGVLATQLAIFMKVTTLDKMAIFKGVGLMVLAGSIWLLAQAVKEFAKIDPQGLVQGLVGVGVLLTQLGIFANLTGNSKSVIRTAIGIGILAGSLLIFGLALKLIGSMFWDDMFRGLFGVSYALMALTAAVNFMPANMALKAAGFAGIAASLLLLALSMKAMSGMDWEEIGKSLTVLAGSLTILGVAMAFMQTPLTGAAALAIVSGALVVLAVALRMLGTMSLAEIGKGLLALVGVFVLIGGAALVISPLIPAILALSGAILVFGLACLAIGAGVMLFSAGLAGLAVSGSAAAAALVVVVTSIVGLIPFIATSLAEGIVAFARILAEGMPIITEAVVNICLGVVAAILAITPVVVEGLMMLLDDIFNALELYVPKIVDSAIKMVEGILKAISDNKQQVTETAIQIVINFIAGIRQMLPKVIQASFDFVIAFINGVAEALRGNTEPLVNSLKNLISAVLESGVRIFLGSLSLYKDLGSRLIESGVIKGLKEKIGQFPSKLTDMAKDGIKALTDKIGGFTQAGKDVISGFIKGMVSKIKEIASEAANLAGTALTSAKKRLGIESPSKEFARIGMYANEGLAGGLKKYTKTVVDASMNVGNTAIDSLKGAISNVADIVSGDIDMNPTIRPVLDLTDVKAGGKTISSIFGTKQTLNVETTASKASSITKGMTGEVDLKSSIKEAIYELKGSITSQLQKQAIDVSGLLTVQVQNDRGEIIGIAQTAIKDILRRESR